MRYLLLALCLLAGLESAASACSCRGKLDDAARSTLARKIASDATALVEVELISPYDPKSGRGERLRVRRVLAGRAGPTVEVERLRPPHGAACDVSFPPGYRRVIYLTPPLHSDRRRPLYRVPNSCTAIMLADPAMQQAVIAAMRLQGRR